MTGSMTAVAQRYRELGFRVIKGDGTGELILRSTGLAWAVAKRHDHVLGDLREEREKIDAPNLGARFDEHVRARKYRSARTGKDYDCFDLTQTGILIVGAKYDATLRLLLALLFNAVSTGNEAEADSFVRQITTRLREIRGKARQVEFDLTIVDESDAGEDATPTLDKITAPPSQPAIERDDNVLHVFHDEDWQPQTDRQQHNINDSAQVANALRALSGKGPNYDPALDTPDPERVTIYTQWPGKQRDLFETPTPKPKKRDEIACTHTSAGHSYYVQLHFDDDKVSALRIVDGATTSFFRLPVLGPVNETISLNIGSNVPRAVVIEVLPPGMPAVSICTILHYVDG